MKKLVVRGGISQREEVTALRGWFLVFEDYEDDEGLVDETWEYLGPGRGRESEVEPIALAAWGRQFSAARPTPYGVMPRRPRVVLVRGLGVS
jgi:hypothetical protein